MSATGQFVQITASQAANSIVVRYVIPDAPAGGGINATISLYVNGTFRQQLNLTSKYSWTYGGESNSTSNNPADGGVHHFYDETRALVGSIPAGATVKLQKDGGDTAAYYVVDLIDLEQVGSPLSMPANYLSITTDCGATANDGTDDGPKIQTCINNAKAQGKGVWIPSGTFDSTTTPLSQTGVVIRGAGMWYSIVHGFYARFNCTGGNCQYYDFAILGETTFRDDASPENGFNGTAGPGSRLQNIWVEHTKVGYWLGAASNGIVITGCRMRDMFADGVNFYKGTSNSVVENSHFRNTGDDAMASWSPTSGAMNVNNTFRFNTVQSPWRASCYAVNGGQDIKVEDNLCYDDVLHSGILLNQQFTSNPFTGTTSVQRNSMIRVGGNMYGIQWGALELRAFEGPISGFLVKDNYVQDSTFAGLRFEGPFTISAASIQNLTIVNPGTWGIHVAANTKGSADLSFVTVTNPVLGGLANDAGGNFTITRGPGNTGW